MIRDVVIMWQDEPQIHIELDLTSIRSELLTDNLHPVVRFKCLPSLEPSKITLKSFERFLETRLPDKTRDDMDFILRRYNLKEYNPYAMCRKSHGRIVTDFMWMKIDGEEVTYSDIRLR